MPKSNQMSFKKLALATAITSLLGCGGGGGDSSPNTSADINTNDVTKSLSGSIQKGPFVAGASITVYELDENLKQTGISHRTNTTDNKGSYSLSATIQSKYVEVFASGYYYDETTGSDSESPYELSAIVDVSEVHTANLNLLTSLAKDRIRTLVAEGKGFSEANDQVKQEVLRVFNLQNFDIELHDLDVLKPTDSGGILLAASSNLMQIAHNATSGSVGSELTSLMANIKSDLNDNGIIDTDSIKTKIKEASIQLDIPSVKSALQKKFELSSAPKMEDFLDNDGDGEIGANALKKISSLVTTDTTTSASGNAIPSNLIGRGAAISDDKKKAIVLGSTKGFQIYDISKPESPVHAGSFLNTTYRISQAVLSNDGNTLFAYEASPVINIYDITDPASPSLVGSYTPSSYVANMTLSTDNKLIIGSSGKLEIVDVSNLSNPVSAGQYTSKNNFFSNLVLSNDGKTAFYTNNDGRLYGKSGIYALDISNPQNISLISSYEQPNTTSFSSLGITGSNTLLVGVSTRAENTGATLSNQIKTFTFKNQSFNEISSAELGPGFQLINSDVFISKTAKKLEQYTFDQTSGFNLIATHSVASAPKFSSDGQLLLTTTSTSIDLYGF